MATIQYEDIIHNDTVRIYLSAGNDALGVIGFTEHGFAHAAKTAETAAEILTGIGAPAREVELAKIAGYMHDIGNMVNRHDHAMTGAVIAMRLLESLGMPACEVAQIATAIGNHDEGTGQAVSRVTAALIIADKSDVRRSRVRNASVERLSYDIHDRVNYAVRDASLTLSEQSKTLTLSLDIDTSVCPVMDYFEIFMVRMLMCRRAAEFLGLAFKLNINGSSLL